MGAGRALGSGEMHQGAGVTALLPAHHLGAQCGRAAASSGSLCVNAFAISLCALPQMRSTRNFVVDIVLICILLAIGLYLYK